jgi:hypothetical protein
MSDPTSCPNCLVSFQGDPIPQEYIDAGYYGDKTHWSTVIGIYDMTEDCTVAWRCPFCQHEWKRNGY